MLDAAERLMDADGVAGLSLRRLAEESGSSTVTIYHHFGDKLGLEEALLERSATSLEQMLAEAAAVDDDEVLGDRFVQLCQAFRAWAASHPARFSLLFTRDATDRALHGDADDALMRCLEPLARFAPDGDGSQSWALAVLAGLAGFVSLDGRDLLEAPQRAESFEVLVRSLRIAAPAPLPHP